MTMFKIHLILMILAMTLGCAEDEKKDGIIDEGGIVVSQGNRFGQMSLMVKPLMNSSGINYGGSRAGSTMNSRPIQTATPIYILMMDILLSRA